MEINQEGYNKVANQWHDYRSKMPINTCVVDFAAKIKPQGKILDIGCGTGYPILEYLWREGFEVTGIDSSENMLQKALEMDLKGAKLYLCDFFEYQPKEKYDGVIAFDSLWHLPKARQAEIYSKIAAWMKGGARLLFTHGKENSEKEGIMFGEKFYYSALDTVEVHRLLLENGFMIETSIEDYKEATTGERDLLIVAKKIA